MTAASTADASCAPPPPPPPWPPRWPPPARDPGPPRAADRRSRADRAPRRGDASAGWAPPAGASTSAPAPCWSTRTSAGSTPGLFTGAFNPATPLTVRHRRDRRARRPGRRRCWSRTPTGTTSTTCRTSPRRTGARVFGTLTAYHLGLASGVPVGAAQPGQGRRGAGLRRLHRRGGRRRCTAATPAYSMAFPGVRVSPPPQPGDHRRPAGGRHAGLPADGRAAARRCSSWAPATSSSATSTGLRPDVAMVAMPSATTTHDYVPRLLEALDQPAGRGAGALGQLRDAAAEPAAGRPGRPRSGWMR